MRTKRTRGLNCTGQALVEMAFILPILLLLVLGIFEFGRAMYTKNSLTNAARAAARAAVVTSSITTDSAKVKDTCDYSAEGQNGIVFSAACNSLTPKLRTENIFISMTAPSPLTAGSLINVKVHWDNYTTVAPIYFIPQLANITLYGETAMRYE